MIIGEIVSFQIMGSWQRPFEEQYGDFLQNYQNTIGPSNSPPGYKLEMIFENQFGIVKLIHTIV